MKIQKKIDLYNLILLRIKNNRLKILVFISIFIPFFIFLNNILNGSIPFWYDPARDFLLALNNLKKPTLIGPPSGIPGVFYGPYWIWMISLGLIITKDPRFVAFLICFLPYFTVFPFILWKFSYIFSKKISVLLWFLFIFSFQTYTTFLWNPHIAPLLFLLLSYLLISLTSADLNKKYLFKILGAGIVGGLLLNFHISFGLGVFISSIIYLSLIMLFILRKVEINFFKKVLYQILALFLFVSGFVFTLIPFIVFEFRHDFLQSRALYKTIINAVIYNSASVGQTGLKPLEIFNQLFIERTAQLLSIKPEYILSIYLLVIYYLIYRFLKEKKSFTVNEKNIILYSFICVSIFLILFTSSKNPVWVYHFIGVEIIFLLLTGITLKKWELFRNIISFWVAVFILSGFINYLNPYKASPLTFSSLASKRYIVDRIYQDADDQSFSVIAYSSAIYTYDYDYIFKWLGEDFYHKMPVQDITQAKSIYLIIPKGEEAVQNDFISAKTPNRNYSTEKTWTTPDGTTIIKRIPLKIDTSYNY